MGFKRTIAVSVDKTIQWDSQSLQKIHAQTYASSNLTETDTCVAECMVDLKYTSDNKGVLQGTYKNELQEARKLLTKEASMEDRVGAYVKPISDRLKVTEVRGHLWQDFLDKHKKEKTPPEQVKSAFQLAYKNDYHDNVFKELDASTDGGCFVLLCSKDGEPHSITLKKAFKHVSIFDPAVKVQVNPIPEAAFKAYMSLVVSDYLVTNKVFGVLVLACGNSFD